MDSNTNEIVSVKNEQNKTDVMKMKDEETNQLLPNSNAVCTSSKPSSFVNFCKENNVVGCDEKNMQIFKRLSETSW